MGIPFCSDAVLEEIRREEVVGSGAIWELHASRVADQAIEAQVGRPRHHSMQGVVVVAEVMDASAAERLHGDLVGDGIRKRRSLSSTVQHPAGESDDTGTGALEQQIESAARSIGPGGAAVVRRDDLLHRPGSSHDGRLGPGTPNCSTSPRIGSRRRYRGPLMSARRPSYSTGDPVLDSRISELLDVASVSRDRELVSELVTSVLRMSREGVNRGDLKIANSTLKEMRYAFQVFDPYRAARKLAIFGSARTGTEEPAYDAARRVGQAISDEGWMVITGGGPGIMTAGIEGAGPENSFAVNIVLPFEPREGGSMVHDGKSINFRYFFTRKLTFMKEASAYVMFPGGFGTMDETFELLTLLQTGRELPAPIVLFQPDGDGYWETFRRFLEIELLDSKLIRPEDLELFHITSDVDDVVEHVTSFFRVYDSLRHVGGRLVLRLRKELTDAQLQQLNEQFGDIVVSGRIERAEVSSVEIADDDAVDLHRIRFRFTNDGGARLHAMIDVINTF